MRTSREDKEATPRPRLCVGPSTGVFLARGCSDPDTISLRLMKSGDVESNPGPSSTVCKICEKPFLTGHKPIQCRKCLGWYHSTSCSSTKGDTIKDIRDSNSTWTCIECDTEECDCGRLPGSNRKCRGNGSCRKIAATPHRGRRKREERRRSDGGEGSDEGEATEEKRWRRSDGGEATKMQNAIVGDCELTTGDAAG